jgi:hypothetical protein
VWYDALLRGWCVAYVGDASYKSGSNTGGLEWGQPCFWRCQEKKRENFQTELSVIVVIELGTSLMRVTRELVSIHWAANAVALELLIGRLNVQPAVQYSNYIEHCTCPCGMHTACHSSRSEWLVCLGEHSLRPWAQSVHATDRITSQFIMAGISSNLAINGAPEQGSTAADLK